MSAASDGDASDRSLGRWGSRSAPMVIPHDRRRRRLAGHAAPGRKDSRRRRIEIPGRHLLDGNTGVLHSRPSVSQHLDHNWFLLFSECLSLYLGYLTV
jgi:hypothetical protein